MTTAIIITVCSLLLLAYLFDISSRLTKIPSVIFLLLLGWTVRQITHIFQIDVPDLQDLLPIFGTIGLILIVLEGSLELSLDRSKIPLIRKSFFLALFPLIILAVIIALTLQHYEIMSLRTALVNAIPLCVISSAIAIPSVRNLSLTNREFVTYESSLSDIIGVLLFNFIALNEVVNMTVIGVFGLEIILIMILSLIAAIGLSFLLSRISHHVTFSPIILLVILIYAISKVYHLPGLIFIFLFGLFLGNMELLKRFRWIERLRPAKLDKEIIKFREVTYEATFMIRALFFLLFGFQMSAQEILDLRSLPWSVGIVIAIFVIRFIFLKLSSIPIFPILFVTPRGLITILLFISISPELATSIVNQSLIIQTIVLSVLVMMIGSIISREKNTDTIPGISTEH